MAIVGKSLARGVPIISMSAVRGVSLLNLGEGPLLVIPRFF